MGTIPALDDCKPGLRASGFSIIVAMEPIPGVASGIHLPDEVIEKRRLLQVRGRLVDMSPVAFDFAQFPDDALPKIGDAVMIAKLAGTMITGNDGREYRVCLDKDLVAIVDEEEAA
jgi:co-chaperonin GroES (HSP10)